MRQFTNRRNKRKMAFMRLIIRESLVQAQVGPRTAKTLISRQINLKIRVFPFVFAEYVA